MIDTFFFGSVTSGTLTFGARIACPHCGIAVTGWEKLKGERDILEAFDLCVCDHCQAVNVFTGTELREAVAEDIDADDTLGQELFANWKRVRRERAAQQKEED